MANILSLQELAADYDVPDDLEELSSLLSGVCCNHV
jgi:hypothetical protein